MHRLCLLVRAYTSRCPSIRRDVLEEVHSPLPARAVCLHCLQGLLETGFTREAATYGAVKSLQTPSASGVTLTWHDVTVYVPDKRDRSLLSSCRGAPKLKRVLNNGTCLLPPAPKLKRVLNNGTCLSCLVVPVSE